MCPALIVQLPNASVSVRQSSLDRGHRDLNSLPMLVVQPVMTGGSRQKLESFPKSIELELLIDPIADLVGSAWIPGQMFERALTGHLTTPRCVGRLQLWPVSQQPLGHELDRRVEKWKMAVTGYRFAGVTLIPDPGIPIVIVTTLARPFGQTHRRRGDHSAVNARHAKEHGHCLLGIPRSEHPRIELRDGISPALFSGVPQGVRLPWSAKRGHIADLENQIAALSRS